MKRNLQVDNSVSRLLSICNLLSVDRHHGVLLFSAAKISRVRAYLFSKLDKFHFGNIFGRFWNGFGEFIGIYRNSKYLFNIKRILFSIFSIFLSKDELNVYCSFSYITNIKLLFHQIHHRWRIWSFYKIISQYHRLKTNDKYLLKIDKNFFHRLLIHQVFIFHLTDI